MLIGIFVIAIETPHKGGRDQASMHSNDGCFSKDFLFALRTRFYLKE